MTTKEWLASRFHHCYAVPFDEADWQASIGQLGVVMAAFLSNNKGKRIISAVDNDGGPLSTHGAMMNVAIEQSGASVERYPKRVEARVSPLSYLRGIMSAPEPTSSFRLPDFVGKRPALSEAA